VKKFIKKEDYTKIFEFNFTMNSSCPVCKQSESEIFGKPKANMISEKFIDKVSTLFNVQIEMYTMSIPKFLLAMSNGLNFIIANIFLLSLSGC
jgi:hypothetical protein